MEGWKFFWLLGRLPLSKLQGFFVCDLTCGPGTNGLSLQLYAIRCAEFTFESPTSELSRHPRQCQITIWCSQSLKNKKHKDERAFSFWNLRPTILYGEVSWRNNIFPILKAKRLLVDFDKSTSLALGISLGQSSLQFLPCEATFSWPGLIGISNGMWEGHFPRLQAG